MRLQTEQACMTQSFAIIALGVLSLLWVPSARTQETRDAKAIVASAVQTELAMDRADHTAFIYLDHDVTPDHDTLFQVVETPQGSLKRKIQDRGRAISVDDRHIDDLRIHAMMNDGNAQQRQKRNAAHDDEQAEQMLKLLPAAFLWTIKSESDEYVTLAFKPDPQFDAGNIEARVLSSMAGEITIARRENRIRSIEGKLVQDVKIAFGIFGRLQSGGTFQVERREVIPHHWQVTETHVHILGHVFFKTIGSQEDETRSEFKKSPAQNLQAAYDFLEGGKKLQDLECCRNSAHK